MAQVVTHFPYYIFAAFFNYSWLKISGIFSSSLRKLISWKKNLEILVSEYAHTQNSLKRRKMWFFSWHPDVCACVSDFQCFKAR